MEIGFTTLDPELSAQLANTLVSQYISFNSKKETEIARESVSFLADQIERLEGEIQENERLLREYSQRDDVLLMDADVLYPQVTRATVEVLTRLGFSVRIPDSGCCGTLHLHAGDREPGRGHPGSGPGRRDG